jgi:hypothetical protein
LKIALKIAKIEGEIPPIGLKYVKIGEFALHNRKASFYFTKNELHFAYNRKTSPYFMRLLNLSLY